MKKLIALSPLFLVLAGCATLYTGVVTITSVVDSAMKDWAALSVAGKTTPAIDAKVTAAHDKYREACSTAQKALIAYKATGDNAAYIQALAVCSAVAGDLVNLIVPLVTNTEAVALQNKLAKAKGI